MNYPREVNLALNWLEQKGFIRRTNSNKNQSFQCKILPAPDFHPGINDFIECTNVHYNLNSLKANNHGFIMVPTAAFDDTILMKSPSVRKIWTDRKLKTLLLLYAHCWLEYFGGIDPNIVSIDSNGTMSLYEGFCYNLKSSEKQVGNVIIWLVSNGFLKPVECYFERGVYYGDVGCCPPPQQYEIKIVLRPYYLIQHKIESDLMKTKRGRLIL